MKILGIFFIITAIVAQLFIMKFQVSPEGNDERGKYIQVKTSSFLYSFLSWAVVISFFLSSKNVFTSEQMLNLLLFFYVSLNIVGAVYIFWKRKTC
ncbi:hypothetical protein SAMN04489735_101959 [Aneurinibacillus thermoaerophilus]|uniref:Uncharacterized protein n=1 Tax=Aneurinibacillus thermoaerophilus TaxID=143495 RepID=A0A1G8BG85_ANETH|nr:hypothetical protein [Aneurinibacillus thermoaerophilus]MED0674261.1 hypothetical protein [Aneurinibacillus thermoaerophilus]SDH32256.1 hypothetical protein SAMN04489735_101959 [Aneurinibacillus thermoaerophilus]